jgi:hypothetical protein
MTNQADATTWVNPKQSFSTHFSFISPSWDDHPFISSHLISSHPFACSNLVSHYLKAVCTSPKRLWANSKCSSSKYITQLWWKTILGKSKFESFCRKQHIWPAMRLWLHFRVVVWNRLGFTCSERHSSHVACFKFISCSWLHEKHLVFIHNKKPSTNYIHVACFKFISCSWLHEKHLVFIHNKKPSTNCFIALNIQQWAEMNIVSNMW